MSKNSGTWDTSEEALWSCSVHQTEHYDLTHTARQLCCSFITSYNSENCRCNHFGIDEAVISCRGTSFCWIIYVLAKMYGHHKVAVNINDSYLHCHSVKTHHKEQSNKSNSVNPDAEESGDIFTVTFSVCALQPQTLCFLGKTVRIIFIFRAHAQ